MSRRDSDDPCSSCCDDCECDSNCSRDNEENLETTASKEENEHVCLDPGSGSPVTSSPENNVEKNPKSGMSTGLFRQLSVLVRGGKKKVK